MHMGLTQWKSSAGASSGNGGASPVEEDEKPSPSVCEISVHRRDIEDNHDERGGLIAEAAHADGSGESEEVNYDGWAVKAGIEKEEALRLGRVRRNVTNQEKEKEAVVEEEKTELHVKEDSKSCKVVGLKVAHKGGRGNDSAVNDCFMGSSKFIANIKKVDYCLADANCKQITNAPHLFDDSCSNRISRSVDSDSHDGGSGILNSNSIIRKNCIESMAKKSLYNGGEAGGLGVKSLEYHVKKLEEKEVRAVKTTKKLAKGRSQRYK